MNSLLKKVDDYIIIEESEDLIESFVKDNKVQEGTSSVSNNYFVSLWKGKKKVTGSLSSLKSLNKLVNSLKVAPEMKYFHGLPDVKKYKTVKLYDPKIGRLGPNALISQVEELRDSIVSSNVDATMGLVGRSITNVHVQTSRGFDAEYKESAMAVSASATARLNGSIATGWESFESKQKMSNGRIGKTAKQKALDGLHQKKVKLPKTVVLSPRVISQLLSYCVLSNLSLDSVEEKSSAFQDKLGEKIMGNISITDDPTIKFGTKSYPFDAEGSPAKKTTLVRKGVLKNFISDYNTAIELNMPHTANAGSGGIDFSNISLSGTTTIPRSYVMVGDVIGAHTADPLTSRFSVIADSSYKVSNGKQTPVAPFMISGNFLDVLSNCSFMGRKECRDGITSKPLVSKSIQMVIP